MRTSTRDTVAETAAFGDVVLLAVPGGAAADVLASLGTLAGKVVVDATNFGPGAAALAAQVPDARVVKAFNTVFAAIYDSVAAAERPPSQVYCGDDAGAKEAVAQLIADAGFEPVDAGGLDMAADVEALARLVIGIAYRQGRGPFFYRFEAS